MKHDLVVFVPGITGTRLSRDGKDLWNPSLRALLGAVPPQRLFTRLRLPDGIGDERPEEPFAVEARELVTRPTGVPGLLMHHGYPDVTDLLTGVRPEQFVVFPYDWRLSNRITAKDLKVRVERELGRWREEFRSHYPKAEDDPEVVLICHSMGGLVARYYLECLGGRDTARTLVTVGTPHRGAAKAIRFLTGHGVGKGLLGRTAAAMAGGVNERLADLCRTFPSMGQLLPVYEAVRRPEYPEGYYEQLTDIDVGIPTATLEDVFDFHDTFEAAALKNLRESPDRGLPYQVRCLGGRAHPTVHGVVVSPGQRLDFLYALDDVEPWTGDGTVPAESAYAAWALRSTDEAVWNGHRHGSLISREAFGHQLDSAYNSKTSRDTLAADDEFGLVAPEFAVAGEPFEVVATGVERGRTVRASLHPDGTTAPESSTLLSGVGRDERRGSLTAGPGTWVLSVWADRPRVVQRDVVMVVEP
ncbi:lipase/acyltransferase domain-containing protein [Streptomyces sp. P1-3]|uniref:lipase/acyltransferase domain-containing protein n=1 Tax=Streptomyces sp. P1-3 TaxID=3421658 RepID=UPI003D35D945